MISVNVKSNKVSINAEHVNLGKYSIKITKILFVGHDALITRHIRYGRILRHSYSGRIIIISEDTKFNVTPASNFLGLVTEKQFIQFNNLSTSIKKITFNNRIKKYLDSIKQKGFFDFSNFQFTPNGDLFERGRFICNVIESYKHINHKDHNFLINVPRSKIFLARIFPQKTHKISIYFDFDCFYALLQNILGLTITNNEVLKLKPDAYYGYALRLATQIANADGRVLKQELKTLKKSLNISHHTCPDASDIFNAELQNPTPLNILTQNLDSIIGKHSNLKQSLLIALVEIALSDGELHLTEVKILKKIAEQLGLSDRLDSLLAAFSKKPNQSNENQRTTNLKVLGLSATATNNEIKTKYKTLVREYHPDILRGAGAGYADIDRAEKLLQKINSAYSLLINQKS